MPKTLISDIIVPAVFNPYVTQRTAELSAIYRSGIIARSPELDRLAAGGGRLLNMPYFEDLTGEDELLSDLQALDVDRITTGRDVARLHGRGKAWSVNDLAEALSGADPMRAIGDLAAEFWARRMQVFLLATLEGVFADASMATNVYDAGARIDADETILALQMLGDAKSRLTAFAMHSAVEADLARQDLIDFTPESEGRPTVATYLGKPVIVDDGCPFDAATGTYTTYIFGQGAIAWGEGAPPVPTETDRDSLAGDDILVNRRHFILHPRGVRWTETAVTGDEFPTNDDLRDPDNWDRVYEPKNVRMVRFTHTIG